MKPMGEVIATNYLKGGLDISKVVSTTQINVTDGVISNVTEPKKNGLKTVTDEFTYEIKLWKVDDSGNKSAVYTYDDQIKADGSATISGSIGYRIFSNPTATDGAGNITFGTQARGAILTENSQYADLANGIFATIANNETTIVLTMPANGEIRLVNLPAGTQYTVTEVLDEDGTAGGGYTYAATESTVKSSDDDITDPIVSTGNAVSGKITGNKANIETYYNWAANFYVYHSSNNTIEKISFADERVDSTYDAEKGYQYSFNIVDETAEGTLYGGYYKAYSQAGITKQAIVAAEYTADDNGKLWYQDSAGKPYDAKKANIWKKAEAYTTEVEETGGGKGTEMAPVANNVYYLKEVPNGYIRPYIHFTYDDIDPEKPLKHLYVITASDDTNYDYVGYVLGDSEEGTKATTSSLLITIKKANGKTEASLTASSVFKNKEYHGETVTLTRGYLHMSDLTTNIGKAFTFQPCWNTLDDVLVKGFTVRTVNAGTSAESIGVEDVAAN